MKAIVSVIIIALIVMVYFLNTKKKPMEDNTQFESVKRKRLVEEKVENKLKLEPIKIQEVKKEVTNKELKVHDHECDNFIKSGDFKSAIKHIVKKSEEHISDSPSAEDFIQKLNVLDLYIEQYPDLIKRDFDFYISYFTLNAFDKRAEKVEELIQLLDTDYKAVADVSDICFEFFKEVSQQNVSYNSLSKVVFNCASNENKRTIVFDYIQFLKENKDENYAMQEYTKLRLLYNDLPEYGTF